MKMFQLNDFAVRSCGDCGKKLMMKHRAINNTEMAMIGRPQRPRLQRRGSKSSPCSRFRSIQPTEMTYELRSAPVPSEVTMLNATALPRFISDKSMENV